jgi:LysM repeat protein
MGNKQDDAQYDDTRNSHYRQAQQDLDDNKPADAAAEYESALEANPKLSGAQYQLGILYGEKLQDPLSSIYHFKRFLELAPNSDHASNAKEMIDKETQVFASSVSSSSAPSGDVAKIQADNIALQKQVDAATHTIAQLQGQLARAKRHHDTTATATTTVPAPETPANPAPDSAASTAPVSSPTSDANASTSSAASPAPTTPPAPTGPLKALPLDAPNPALEATNAPGTPAAPTGPSKSYTVVKGDSLWKISHKMYPGDTKNGVEKIQDANKDSLGTKPLKIGQVLIIPQ